MCFDASCKTVIIGLPGSSIPLRTGRHVQRRRKQERLPAAQAINEQGSSDELVYDDFLSASKALEALEDYTLLMQEPEPSLLRGAVLIARHRYPLLQYEHVVDQLDDLAMQTLPTLPASRYPLQVVRAISSYLYENRKFRGNDEDYYNPRNSCINEVLARRLGIPLTLSIVYMEVARRCGFELYGASVPGRFLLTPADPDLEFFIDAFEGGKVALLDDVEATLTRIYGRSFKIDPSFCRRKEQLPSRTFLARMLNNLKVIYAARKNYAGAYSMSRYLRATRPGDLDEVRDQGFILWHLKRYSECAAVLREYLARAPEDAEDAPKVRRLLRALRDVDDGSGSEQLDRP